jgi:hypothetical protein
MGFSGPVKDRPGGFSYSSPDRSNQSKSTGRFFGSQEKGHHPNPAIRKPQGVKGNVKREEEGISPLNHENRG